MRTVWFVILAFAAAVLDASAVPEAEILGTRPDLLVLVVVYGGLVLGARPATLAGFALGLVADTELPEYLGLHALALSTVGYVTAAVWDRLVRANVLVQCAVLFGATLLHDVIYYLVYYRNHMDMFGRFIVRFGLSGALYTAVLGVLVYAVARAAGWRGIADGTHA